MQELTHVNSDGKAEMVDVSSKKETLRTARAYGEVLISTDVHNAIKKNLIKKGDVLTIAKIAGIQGAKKTSELIPLCHNIFISKVDVSLELHDNKIFCIHHWANWNRNGSTYGSFSCSTHSL